MDDARLVRRGEAGEHRLGDVEGLLGGQRSVFLDEVAQLRDHGIARQPAVNFLGFREGTETIADTC